jgi:hypothetical protein
MYSRPNEADVQKVMRETGMDYLQAYRHVQQRNYLRERLQRR